MYLLHLYVKVGELNSCIHVALFSFFGCDAKPADKLSFIVDDLYHCHLK